MSAFPQKRLVKGCTKRLRGNIVVAAASTITRGHRPVCGMSTETRSVSSRAGAPLSSHDLPSLPISWAVLLMDNRTFIGTWASAVASTEPRIFAHLGTAGRACRSGDGVVEQGLRRCRRGSAGCGPPQACGRAAARLGADQAPAEATAAVSAARSRYGPMPTAQTAGLW